MSSRDDFSISIIDVREQKRIGIRDSHAESFVNWRSRFAESMKIQNVEAC